tara:strand:- start:800 stop:1456 length:657 start_codon:yes stop_codon:yes gene_type:complete
MFEWTEKFQPQEDWVTILLLIIFALCSYLYLIGKHQFGLLISIWKSKNYFTVYDKEKYASPLHQFNAILMFITLIAFSILGYFFYNKILLSIYGKISFITILGVLTAMAVTRYGLLRLVFTLSGHTELYQQIVFRSLSFYGSISLYGLFIFSFYYYSFITDTNLLLIVIILILCLVFISHLTIYFRIISMNLNNIVYLILYLCAFKIVPWLWLYKLIF